MVVLIISSVPQKVRGYVTLFLFKISVVVYVGNLNKRVREELWINMVSMLGNESRVCMCYSDNSLEQGFNIILHNYEKEIVDIDGVKVLMDKKRPTKTSGKRGWSKQRWRNKRT